jgi:hypothetical protein
LSAKLTRWATVALWSGLALSGCASVSAPAQARDPVGEVVQQPFRDLSLVQEVAPPALAQAAADPYRRVSECGAVKAELAELDRTLGPDVDTVAIEESGTGLAADLVSGMLDLPFRGLVRRVSGAEKRDAALRHAVASGMVRRGFLKGLAAQLDCRIGVASGPSASAP